MRIGGCFLLKLAYVSKDRSHSQRPRGEGAKMLDQVSQSGAGPRPAIAAFRDWMLDETRQTNLKVDEWLRRISSEPDYVSLKIGPG